MRRLRGQAQRAAEVLVDFGLGAVLAVAQRADQGDHVQPGLGLGQSKAALGLGAVRPVEERAAWANAAADLQAQAHQALQGEHGSAVIVSPPHRPGAVGASLAQGLQRRLARGPGSGSVAGHRQPGLIQTHPNGEFMPVLMSPITPHPAQGRLLNFASIEKNEIEPWLKEGWCCLPKGPDAAFVCNMEDVLDLYQQPYDESARWWAWMK